jgi:hypothetical protein
MAAWWQDEGVEEIDRGWGMRARMLALFLYAGAGCILAPNVRALGIPVMKRAESRADPNLMDDIATL